MKKLKKVFLITGIVLTLLLLALAVAPMLFKDQIKQKIDSEIAKSVNANVFFSADKFSLSLFRNFPNLTISLNEFGVANKEPFAGDTLVSVQSFRIIVDIMSVISGDKIKVKGIYLDKPRIMAQVNKFGQANWDIAKTDSSTVIIDTTKAEPSNFKLGIEKWKISEGYISYVDKPGKMSAEIIGFNHEGRGDLNASVFDLFTKTLVESITYTMDGTKYLNKNKLDFDINLGMDMDKSKYTFKDNVFRINDFALNFEGFVAMPDTNIEMDLKFGSKDTEFKKILSLVPSVFLKDFEKIKTDGTLAFDGFAKGIYNNAQMPQFGVNLKVNKGMFQYPDLPVPVKNIEIDMLVENKDIIENLFVNIKKFHIDLGNNPVDAKVILKGLTNMDIDANILAKVNLEEITKIFPVQGTTVKGLFSLNANAKGVYNSLEKKMPAVSASMSIKDGFAKTEAFPSAIENIQLSSLVNNATGNLADTKVNVENMNFLMDGQPFSLKLLFENLDDYTWDLNAKGKIDLTKITKIFPLEDMKLSGLIDVFDFNTKGKMSDVTASRYDKMPTSGSMAFTDFVFTSKDLPQGFKMTKSHLTFDPKKMTIDYLDGFLGKSDISITGYLADYISYMFNNGTVQGKMNFKSNKFDVNEWMAEDPNAPVPVDTATLPMTVFEVPKNIDFTLVSDLKSVLYDKMNITDLTGSILVKDGAVRMNQVVFNLLDGAFKTNGLYDTKDLQHPKFDFDLDIKNLAFNKAYETFNTVKTLAPVAKNIDGKFSTTFKMAGELKQDMMPKYETVSGNGVIMIADAKLKDLKVLNGIANLTKQKDLSTVALKDVRVEAEVKDGRVYLKKPVEIKSAGNNMVITGSQGIDGSLDYLMKMDMAAGAVGAAVNGAIANLTGKPSSGDRIKVNFKVEGNSSNPKITPMASDGAGTVKDQIKDAAVDKAKQEADRLKQEAENKAKQEADRLKADAEQRAKQEADKLKIEAEKKKREAEQQLKKKAEEEAKKLKGKLGF